MKSARFPAVAVIAILAVALAVETGPIGAGTGAEPPGGPTTTLTRVGQSLPRFEVSGLDGQSIGDGSLRGKVAVIVFWATWCPSCRAEMPRLEKEIWLPYRSAGLAMLAIAREEPAETVRSFRVRSRYTMPMAVDPSRDAYGRFATEGIPRTYVLSSEGTILFQSVGYDEADFAALKTIVAREMQRLKPPSTAGGR